MCVIANDIFGKNPNNKRELISSSFFSNNKVDLCTYSCIFFIGLHSNPSIPFSILEFLSSYLQIVYIAKPYFLLV